MNCKCIAVEAKDFDEALKELNKMVGKAVVKDLENSKPLTYTSRPLSFDDPISDICRKLGNTNKTNRWAVIISEPAVILIDKETGSKYVSKCAPDDDFNPEIGLMMCFVKYLGLNYHKIIELLDNAKVVEKEFTARKESDRRATARVTKQTLIKDTGKEVPDFTIKPLKQRHAKRDVGIYAIKVGKKFLTEFDLETRHRKCGTVPYFFSSVEEAENVVKKLSLKNADIVSGKVAEQKID